MFKNLNKLCAKKLLCAKPKKRILILLIDLALNVQFEKEFPCILYRISVDSVDSIPNTNT